MHAESFRQFGQQLSYALVLTLACLWDVQVEVAVLVLKEELEEEGLDSTVVEKRVAAERSKLTAEVDAALLQAASPVASRGPRYTFSQHFCRWCLTSRCAIACFVCTSAICRTAQHRLVDMLARCVGTFMVYAGNDCCLPAGTTLHDPNAQ